MWFSNVHRLQSIFVIVQAYVYSAESGHCAAFLANYETKSAARVMFNNKHYNMPPWSISILPDCRNVVFNTAKVWILSNGFSTLYCIKLRFSLFLLFDYKFKIRAFWGIDWFSFPHIGWSSNVTVGNVADKYWDALMGELRWRYFFPGWQPNNYCFWSFGADKCHKGC